MGGGRTIAVAIPAPPPILVQSAQKMARLLFVVTAIAPFVGQAFVQHATLPRVRAVPSAMRMKSSDEVMLLVDTCHSSRRTHVLFASCGRTGTCTAFVWFQFRVGYLGNISRTVVALVVRPSLPVRLGGAT